MNGVAAKAASRAASASGTPPAARPARRRVLTGVPAYRAARPRAPTVSAGEPAVRAGGGGGGGTDGPVLDKDALAVADGQLPAAGVGGAGVIADDQRDRQRDAGREAAGGDGARRVDDAQHPQGALGDRGIALLGEPPERVVRRGVQADGGGRGGMRGDHRPERAEAFA